MLSTIVASLATQVTFSDEQDFWRGGPSRRASLPKAATGLGRFVYSGRRLNSCEVLLKFCLTRVNDIGRGAPKTFHSGLGSGNHLNIMPPSRCESPLVRLSYALMRIAAHHVIHAGEIVTVRSCLGHDTDKLGRPD